ncbi:hypothetical protein KCU88_g465, partial [Aureobasidium melanogenum]
MHCHHYWLLLSYRDIALYYWTSNDLVFISDGVLLLRLSWSRRGLLVPSMLGDGGKLEAFFEELECTFLYTMMDHSGYFW